VDPSHQRPSAQSVGAAQVSVLGGGASPLAAAEARAAWSRIAALPLFGWLQAPSPGGGAGVRDALAVLAWPTAGFAELRAGGADPGERIAPIAGPALGAVPARGPERSRVDAAAFDAGGAGHAASARFGSAHLSDLADRHAAHDASQRLAAQLGAARLHSALVAELAQREADRIDATEALCARDRVAEVPQAPSDGAPSGAEARVVRGPGAHRARDALVLVEEVTRVTASPAGHLADEGRAAREGTVVGAVHRRRREPVEALGRSNRVETEPFRRDRARGRLAPGPLARGSVGVAAFGAAVEPAAPQIRRLGAVGLEGDAAGSVRVVGAGVRGRGVRGIDGGVHRRVRWARGVGPSVVQGPRCPSRAPEDEPYDEPALHLRRVALAAPLCQRMAGHGDAPSVGIPKVVRELGSGLDGDAGGSQAFEQPLPFEGLDPKRQQLPGPGGDGRLGGRALLEHQDRLAGFEPNRPGPFPLEAKAEHARVEGLQLGEVSGPEGEVVDSHGATVVGRAPLA